MIILHYFLGFPPYRTGGLTKYAIDLIKAQAADQHKVMALWPGQIGFINHKTYIKKGNYVDAIVNYELVNPLPVSLDEGITEIDAYMQPCDEKVYIDFLRTTQPDVIHIHTLMGLHREFIDAAEKLKIRTVFTTHDYFGICPKVTLYRYGSVCENDHDCKDCIQCNCNALSLKKIQILQSPAYRILKNSIIVKQIRKRHRGEFFANEVLPEIQITESQVFSMATKYKRLRDYYIGMLSKINLIHFNSTVTEFVYKKYLTPKESRVMTITHQNIADNRKRNTWKPREKLRITLLAPAKPFKGFNILTSALDDLWSSGKSNFELKMFSPVKNPAPYMKVQEEGFSYEQLSSILADTDVMVAPSVWYETFGFTVLEAISYGVPVIVSDHVGAKDIIGNGGVVIDSLDKNSIKDAILSFTVQKQNELRNNIQSNIKIKTWREFLDENYTLYEDRV